MEAQASEYFERALRRLLSEVRLSREWRTLPVVEGARLVELPGETIELETLILATAFSSERGWEGRTLLPGRDYVLNPDLQVELSVAPTQSTVDGFPVLALYGCFLLALEDDDGLPDLLLDASLLTSRMKEFACEDIDPSGAAYYRAEADRKTGEQRGWLAERVTGGGCRLAPAWLEDRIR